MSETIAVALGLSFAAIGILIGLFDHWRRRRKAKRIMPLPPREPGEPLVLYTNPDDQQPIAEVDTSSSGEILHTGLCPDCGQPAYHIHIGEAVDLRIENCRIVSTEEKRE